MPYTTYPSQSILLSDSNKIELLSTGIGLDPTVPSSAARSGLTLGLGKKSSMSDFMFSTPSVSHMSLDDETSSGMTTTSDTDSTPDLAELFYPSTPGKAAPNTTGGEGEEDEDDEEDSGSEDGQEKYVNVPAEVKEGVHRKRIKRWIKSRAKAEKETVATDALRVSVSLHRIEAGYAGRANTVGSYFELNRQVSRSMILIKISELFRLFTSHYTFITSPFIGSSFLLTCGTNPTSTELHLLRTNIQRFPRCLIHPPSHRRTNQHQEEHRWSTLYNRKEREDEWVCRYEPR